MFQKLNIISIILTLCIFGFAYGKYPLFYLYTRSNKLTPVLVDETNIRGTAFSYAKKTYLVIHGFNGAGNNDWLLTIKNNLLQIEDANVLAVDWSEGASGINYLAIAPRVKDVGTSIGLFLSKSGISPLNVHCIGHSLGAHVCGFTGKAGKLARITGLDPAGPNFKGYAASQRLDKTDANFVDNIHGDNILGIQDAIGHKDFYPNGGATQAGCSPIGKRNADGELDPDSKGDIFVSFLSCSHSRVTELFAESIISTCQFTSVPCDTYDNFKKGTCTCSGTSCSRMGHFSINNRQEGKFFLDCNSKTPFCQK